MCEQCNCGDTNAEKTFEEKVKEVLESVRPALQGHGGDVELVGTDQGFSIEKAQRDLNFTPNVGFEEGMQHVKDWLLQIGYI